MSHLPLKEVEGTKKIKNEKRNKVKQRHMTQVIMEIRSIIRLVLCVYSLYKEGLIIFKSGGGGK